MESCSLPSDPLSLQFCMRVQGGVVCRAAGGSAAGPLHAVPSAFPSFPIPPLAHTCLLFSLRHFLPPPLFLRRGGSRADAAAAEQQAGLASSTAGLRGPGLRPLGDAACSRAGVGLMLPGVGHAGGEFPLPPHLMDILGIPIPHGGRWPPFPSQVPPLNTQASLAQLLG